MTAEPSDRLLEATSAARAYARGDLAQVWGAPHTADRVGRILGLFAHPDDEVFCVGGTIARCAQAGAATTIVSLTQGEGGQIRDASAASRRTLGPVRAKELVGSTRALGVDRTECLDLGDGTLTGRPIGQVAAVVREVIEDVAPDVVVTFGADGAYGHPDHITSCLATLEAVRQMPSPPRLLHAVFPGQRKLLLDLLVDWLTSKDERFSGTASFGAALKLFADGSSMLGFAADHLSVEWYPAGSFIIEQGERPKELFCILTGSVDIVVESATGEMSLRDTAVAGSFVGQDGLASGRARNAHVIARDDVTCLVLAPSERDTAAGRGAQAAPSSPTVAAPPIEAAGPPYFTVDVSSTADRKVRALEAHRTQYALDPELLPRRVLHELLGAEHFALAAPGRTEPT